MSFSDAKGKIAEQLVIFRDIFFSFHRQFAADYGPELVWCEASIESRKAAVKKVSQERNFAVIYDNDDLIAGQGTIALEFLEQVGLFQVFQKLIARRNTMSLEFIE